MFKLWILVLTCILFLNSLHSSAKHFVIGKKIWYESIMNNDQRNKRKKFEDYDWLHSRIIITTQLKSSARIHQACSSFFCTAMNTATNWWWLWSWWQGCSLESCRGTRYALEKIWISSRPKKNRQEKIRENFTTFFPTTTSEYSTVAVVCSGGGGTIVHRSAKSLTTTVYVGN